MGPDGDVGVQADAFEAGAARARGRRGGGRAEAPQGLAGPRPERHAARQGRRHGAGEQGLMVGEGVAVLGVFGQSAPPRPEPPAVAGEPREERDEVRIGGRR